MKWHLITNGSWILYYKILEIGNCILLGRNFGISLYTVNLEYNGSLGTDKFRPINPDFYISDDIQRNLPVRFMDYIRYIRNTTCHIRGSLYSILDNVLSMIVEYKMRKCLRWDFRYISLNRNCVWSRQCMMNKMTHANECRVQWSDTIRDIL